MKTAKKGWCKFAARGLLCLSLMMLPLLVAGAYANMADDTAGQPLAKQENTPQPYVWFLCKYPPDGLFKKGHAALLVFDGTKCYYYSYGPESLGFPNDNMFAKTFDTVEEAKAYITGAQEDKDEGDALSDYQYFIGWEITAAQAKTILEVPPKWIGTPWSPFLPDHNCWNMVYASISSAIPSRIESIFPPAPKENYLHNKYGDNDGRGAIGDM